MQRPPTLPSAADLNSLTHSLKDRVQGLQSESGTRIMDLLVPITFRSPRKGLAAIERGVRKVGTGQQGRGRGQALVTIRPTKADRAIAKAVAGHTTPDLEEAAELLTWGADEKLLLTFSVGAWLYATRRPQLQPIANHVLVVSLVSAVLPHLLKRAVDQTRPDRLTVRGHWRGVPWSGSAHDAFPSGHALHMGALASAAGLLATPRRQLARGLAVALSATRILLLAHWASDVAVGFATGLLLERLLRPLTLRVPRRLESGK
jgi:PAP2 superfamily protein